MNIRGALLVAVVLAATGAQTETVPPSLVLITIGSVTGVSIAAAQSRLVRGRKELLLKLEADGLGEALRASAGGGGKP